MKVFVALSALLAIASATPLLNRLIVPSSQYHSQDGIGQYAYGYNDHLSSKQEIKSLDGITRGSYSYIDSNNVLQTVDYVADAGGFRVSATNLPKPVAAPVVPAQDIPQQVAETPEVAAAKSAHFAAIEEAKLRNGVVSVPALFPFPAGQPQQVQDTPEVVLAKAAHFVAIEEAKRRVPAPIVELPKPIADTPEVAQAKAEHLIAVEQAKLRNSYQPIYSGVTIVQSPSLIPSQGQRPLPSSGSSYPYGVVNGPYANYPYSPYVRYHQLYNF
ncbi:cuticle protein-like [Eupeodes corollae]|uniref:cuticle protein-like n=1 Tax=Eupeodes corollae TaxID=290404 RepID=UPI002491F17A|nr:cuticle protein-like [Eupeodes corollae]